MGQQNTSEQVEVAEGVGTTRTSSQQVEVAEGVGTTRHFSTQVEVAEGTGDSRVTGLSDEVLMSAPETDQSAVSSLMIEVLYTGPDVPTGRAYSEQAHVEYAPVGRARAYSMVIQVEYVPGVSSPFAAPPMQGSRIKAHFHIQGQPLRTNIIRGEEDDD